MNRRSFIGKVSQGALGISAASCLLGERTVFAAAQKPLAKNWTWTDGGEKLKPEEQKRRFKQFREAGINAVLFSSFNADVLARAKDQGLETHAWTWALCRGDKELLEKHPDWYDVNRLGESAADKPAYVNYYHFLCPSHPQVGDHLAKVVSDLGDNPNLDGIHLDYIRYPDVILSVALWKKYNLVQNRGAAPVRLLLLRGVPQRLQAADGGRPAQADGPARQCRVASIPLQQRDQTGQPHVEVAHGQAEANYCRGFPHARAGQENGEAGLGSAGTWTPSCPWSITASTTSSRSGSSARSGKASLLCQRAVLYTQDSICPI